MHIKSHCFPRDFMYRKFIVGKDYMCFNRRVTFIRSTHKGFNFMDHENNKLLLMGYHLYAKGYGGKPIPDDIKEVEVNIHRSWGGIIRD